MRELTSEENAVLIHQSHTRSRLEQKRYLQGPSIVARAVEIFLECLLVDQRGKVLNHDDAESRGADYIQDHCR